MATTQVVPDASSMPRITPSERCRLCVLPRRLQSIPFNDAGVCDLCTAAQERSAPDPPPSDYLEEFLATCRQHGRHSQWDCVVGLSGGRDSMYLTHLLVREHKLRCLAVYYRTPFTHDIIDQCVHHAVNVMNLKLLPLRISTQQHVDIARRFFLLWLQHPIPELANLTCAQCKMVNREAFRVARQHGVKTLIFGGNPFEDVQFLPAATKPGGQTEGTRDNLYKVARIAVRGVKLLRRCPTVLAHLPIAFKSSMLYLNPHSSYLRLRYPEISRIDYFNHAPWKEQECVATVQREFDWKPPPYCVGTWKADCAFADLKEWMFYQMFGSTYHDCMLSNLIRAGQTTRAAALAQIANSPFGSRARAAECLRLMGLPENILDRPVPGTPLS